MVTPRRAAMWTAARGLTLTATILAHEAGHWTAASWFGHRPRITFNRRGAQTLYDPGSSPREDAVITLAGPVAQAAFILFLRRKDHRVAGAVVALASLARNIAPVPSADGERLWGNTPGSARPRWLLYTFSSLTCLATAGVGRSFDVVADNAYIFDLYVRTGRELTERIRFFAIARTRGIVL